MLLGAALPSVKTVSASVDILHPERPKRIVIVASNPAVSEQTGWPIGFWWAELSHPYWEFTEHGYEVDVASPDGGPLRGDALSDPRDDSGYSAEDLISLGFINSPAHMKLVEDSKPLAAVRVDDYDGVLFVGGEGPMYTFVDDERVHALVASFYEAGRVTAVICHATCVLLRRDSRMGASSSTARPGPASPTRRSATRRLRRATGPAVLDRGRGEEAREHQLHRRGPLQAACRARRQPDHGPAAVLRRPAARLMIEALGI